MKEILIGAKYTETTIVKEEDLACKWGSGKARVYATPSMIAFMEITSTHCIDQFLEGNEITVGTMVNIKHLKASPINSKVVSECEILEVNKKEILLSVKCFVNGELIGSGTHTRYVVDKVKFEEKYS
ncbi:thioesterase family protein [Oceanivirga salmonicida]|uniref:thioesterase family protein n=1 Tax=Oceanivirga salmonicida TaxID=1769291 RepID=UPI00082AF5DB|nr:thioesterase family protein [Oceanivirga salmonicida]